jgi:CcmD family protein
VRTSILMASQAAEPKAAPTTEGASEDRAQSFRAVEGGNQMQSGERLLVEAYAAIWLIVFGMLLLSWRRQRRLDRRIDALDAAIAKARGSDADTGTR